VTRIPDNEVAPFASHGGAIALRSGRFDMGTNQSVAGNGTVLTALMRQTAAVTVLFSRNARCFRHSAAADPSACTSKGEPGAVRG
jgi:hypothetical protein